MVLRVLLPLIAALCFLSPARAAIVALETHAAGLSVGDTFEVRLMFTAEGEEFLSAFIVDVLASGAEVLSATLTDQLDLPGGTEEGASFVNLFGDFAQLFAVSSNTDAQLAEGQATAFAVATLTMRATEAGMMTITLGSLRDFAGASFGALNVAFAPDTLSLAVAAGIAPVPLPPAAALFALGLPLLARRYRSVRGVRTSASVS